MNRKSFFTLAVAALTLAVPSMVRAAGTECYVVFKGNPLLVGESKAKGLEGAIELVSFLMTLTKQDKTAPVTVVFHKEIDRASPGFASVFTNSDPLEATFSFRKPTGDKTLFYTLEGRQGRVSSIKTVKNPDGLPVLEEVTMTFAGMVYTYFPQKPDGSVGPPIRYSMLK